MLTMSDDAKSEGRRPDPLQVALTAIGDFDREVVAQFDDCEIEPGTKTKFQRAQLRVLFALATEVRAGRQELAKHTEYLKAQRQLQLEQYELYQDAHALNVVLLRAQLASMGVQDDEAAD